MGRKSLNPRAPFEFFGQIYSQNENYFGNYLSYPLYPPSNYIVDAYDFSWDYYIPDWVYTKK